ncbi:MAG: PPC domain-containing protein [Actinomycetota bacterium]
MNRWTLAVVFACIAAPAHAQAPSIAGLFPAGGKAGVTVDSAIQGANLADVQAILVSGSGVKVEKAAGGAAASCPVKIHIAPDAELGRREIRVVTSKGVSNAGRIWVGRYPSLIEKEPNNQRSEAQPITQLPATLDGQVGAATDLDRYTFTAAAGETWVFAANAAGHFSNLDPYLTLYDARGRSIDFAMENFGRDPRLIHTFRTGGTYAIEIRDTLYRGGAGYAYRLNVGKLPVVTRWSPMGGQRGQTVQVALTGFNLGDKPGVQVAFPNDPKQSRVRVVPNTPSGPANPLDLFVDDTPEVSDREPNDEVKAAAALGALPARAGGWIGKKGDRDVFTFTAKEKQPFLIDLLARRIGSRLDSVIRVLDSTGKELAANDDAVAKDSRLTFTAPAAGTFFVEVRSLSGNGGDDFFYRLLVSGPPPPDFRLSMTPDNLTAPAGAAAVLTVTAERSGYAGDIALRVENLPAGVTASPATIRTGQNSAIITLTAAPGAAPAGSPIRVLGSASIGGAAVDRQAVGRETFQPPLATPQQARTRDTELAVAGAAAEPPYLLAVTPAAAAVKAGGKLELTVKATRKANYKENIAVTVAGLPPNVTASALTINGDKTEGKITLTVNAKAPTGPAGIAVQGNAKNILVATPATTIEIQPAK